MQFIGQRIRKIRKELNLSQGEFAEKLNLHDFTRISDIERGKPSPSAEVLSDITIQFNVNADWILSGLGSIFKKENSASGKLNNLQLILDSKLKEISGNRQQVTEGDLFEIPVVAEIAAGPPVAATEHDNIGTLAVSRYLVKNRNDYVCFRVNGRSMEPDIHHGDILLINKNCTWRQAMQSIVAVNVNGEITLKKRNLDSSNRMIILNSTNQSYSPIVIDPESQQDIQLIGSLAYLFRKY
ncbi:MAG: XRE family transcriptional regulator [Candidatus Cloacimonetes bacterium]|nr:XRE family transcriptional regulator [Candidatus Cloacimonadota bacterium]